MAKSDKLWEQIRVEFEAGTPVSELADKYDLHANTIHYHKRQDGWIDPNKTTEEQYEERIAELEAALAKEIAEKEALSPVKKVDLPSTVEEVIGFHGEDAFRELAITRIAAENQDRFRKGLPPLDFTNNPHIVDQKVNELAQKMVTARHRPPSDLFRQRVVKMVRPDGMIVQRPVEEQIENEAGQAGASLWKARDKGWKVVEPYICQVRDCWETAATNDHGELSLDGYCSPEHRAIDPYLNADRVSGVATSNAARY